MAEITRQMLRDYLHDSLPDAELAEVEKALRASAKLLYGPRKQKLEALRSGAGPLAKLAQRLR